MTNIDDMREAPSRAIVAELVRRGAQLQAYDPVAMPKDWRVLPDLPGVQFMPSQSAALAGADALRIATEWKEFPTLDFDLIKASLKQPLVLDGRNLYGSALMRTFGND